ncbi:MAG: DUF2961 domain-containing protein, partial [Lentisphaeria bacterium]|nr:DUF2961 domain-containing protein [Lentisphaeria bacterium]
YVAETSFDGSWWLLEGDECIEADGRVFQGTGMEDYFNGGWYYRGASFTPWSGILDRAPFRVGQYRFHLTDPVPFADRFSMQVERGDRNVSHGDIRSVAFFYLDDPQAVPDAAGAERVLPGPGAAVPVDGDGDEWFRIRRETGRRRQSEH